MTSSLTLHLLSTREGLQQSLDIKSCCWDHCHARDDELGGNEGILFHKPNPGHVPGKDRAEVLRGLLQQSGLVEEDVVSSPSISPQQIMYMRQGETNPDTYRKASWSATSSPTSPTSSRFFIRVIVSQLDELVLGEDNVGCLGYVLELELLLEDQVELELDLRELKCRQGPDGQLLVIHLHENMVALLSLASTTAPLFLYL